MRRFFVVIITVCVAFVCKGQQAEIVPSSVVAADASVAYGSWLPFKNPSALGSQQDIEVTILYENRYITKELSNKALSACLPTKHLNIGASFSHFGYSQYHEMLASMSFARNFGNRFNIGVDIVYYTIFLPQPQKYRGTVTTQLGTQINLTDNFVVGVNVFNPTFSKIKGELAEKVLPTIFSLGTNYRLNKEVEWLVQIDKEISSLPRWATGFHYSPVNQMIVKLGVFGYNFVVPTLGAGLRFDNFLFDIDAKYDYRIGLSMLASVGYKFRKK